MIKSKNVRNHITITLGKDDMVYLQRLANLNFVCGVDQGSASSLASFIVRRYLRELQEKYKHQ